MLFLYNTVMVNFKETMLQSDSMWCYVAPIQLGTTVVSIPHYTGDRVGGYLVGMLFLRNSLSS